MDNTQNQIDELYRRSEANAKEVAVAVTRIDIHERECMKKHETVIRKLDTNHDMFNEYKISDLRWKIGFLVGIVMLLLGVMLK